MRSSRLGGVLLGGGLVVGLVAAVGLLVGFEPSRLPPALLDIAAYKLTFIAAAGLLGAGAVLLRRARRDEAPDARSPGTPEVGAQGRTDSRALPGGSAADPVADRPAVPTGERVRRDH